MKNLNKIVVLGLACMIALGSCNKNKPVKVKLGSDIDSVSYCLGLSIGKSLRDGAKLEKINTKLMAKAIEQVFDKDSVPFNDMKINEVIQVYMMKQHQKVSGQNMKIGQDFLSKNKTKSGVISLPSGLQYKVITDGNGAVPKATDMVAVHYKGMSINGKVFDKQEGKDSAKFVVNQVIPAWTEILQKMKVGSKWTIYVPANLAYGERGAGNVIEPNETLIFDIELLKILPAPKAAKK